MARIEPCVCGGTAFFFGSNTLTSYGQVRCLDCWRTSRFDDEMGAIIGWNTDMRLMRKAVA